VADAGQVLLELLADPLQAGDGLLGDLAGVVGLLLLLEGLVLLQRPADGGPVGEQAAQPAVVDVVHAAALGLFLHRVLRLPLRAHEEDPLPLAGAVGDEVGRLLEELQGLLQVDDVDAVAVTEDVGLHLGIPAAGLVPEVDARFEQCFHGYSNQRCLLICSGPRARVICVSCLVRR